jgi:hypothetical protein
MAIFRPGWFRVTDPLGGGVTAPLERLIVRAPIPERPCGTPKDELADSEVNRKRPFGSDSKKTMNPPMSVMKAAPPPVEESVMLPVAGSIRPTFSPRPGDPKTKLLCDGTSTPPTEGVPVVPTPTPVVPVVAPVAGGVKLVAGGAAVVVGGTGVVVAGIAVDVGGVKLVAGGTNAVGGVTTPPPPVVVPTALPVVPVFPGIEVFVPVPVEVPVTVVLPEPELTVAPVVLAEAVGFAPELEPLTPQPEKTIHASRNKATAGVLRIKHL